MQTNAKFISVPGLSAYLPFYTAQSDSNVLAEVQSINTNIYFNRQSQIWNLNYQNTFNKSSTLLTYGVDARFNKEHLLQGRYNINKKLMFQASARTGDRNFTSPFLSTRNYAIAYNSIEPIFTYLTKNNNFNASIGAKIEQKNNTPSLGNEQANISSYFAESRYVISGQSNMRAKFTFSKINFDGLNNSTLSYIMLDGLNSGNNFIFTLGLDKKISKGLELNISYEGRKSENINTIHTGNVSARALF